MLGKETAVAKVSFSEQILDELQKAPQVLLLFFAERPASNLDFALYGGVENIKIKHDPTRVARRQSWERWEMGLGGRKVVQRTASG